jgi:hypothetical protein
MNGIRTLFQPAGAILGVLVTGSGIYTYLGARQLLDGESLLNNLAAIVYAVCVTLAIWLFWMWATRVVPASHSPQSKISRWVAVLLGVGAICGTSSVFNAMALIGPAALQLHERRNLAEYEVILEKTRQVAGRMNTLTPDLNAVAKLYRTLSDHEAVGKGASGAHGKGRTEMLDQVASRFAGLAEQIEASVVNIKEHRREAALILNDMRDLSCRIDVKCEIPGSDGISLPLI